MRIPEIPGYDDFAAIGQGGFSVVYRARQIAFGRNVAIKVMDPPSDDSLNLDVFERECRAVGNLDWCPNIVTVYDAGTTSLGEPYIVMEYAPGGSLGQRLRAIGPMGSDEITEIGAKIAFALHVAHDAGILHRDVKPANVLVGRNGEPLLSDFGIATVSDATRTSTGNVTATVAHAAPEVLNGDRHTVASDIYSLGSTLFMLLAGSPPFGGTGDSNSAVAMITRALTAQLPDPRNYGADERLAHAIDRAMARDPEQRFASALEFARALQADISISEPAPPQLVPIGGVPEPADGSGFGGGDSTDDTVFQAIVQPLIDDPPKEGDDIEIIHDDDEVVDAHRPDEPIIADVPSAEVTAAEIAATGVPSEETTIADFGVPSPIVDERPPPPAVTDADLRPREIPVTPVTQIQYEQTKHATQDRERDRRMVVLAVALIAGLLIAGVGAFAALHVGNGKSSVSKTQPTVGAALTSQPLEIPLPTFWLVPNELAVSQKWTIPAAGNLLHGDVTVRNVTKNKPIRWDLHVVVPKQPAPTWNAVHWDQGPTSTVQKDPIAGYLRTFAPQQSVTFDWNVDITRFHLTAKQITYSMYNGWVSATWQALKADYAKYHHKTIAVVQQNISLTASGGCVPDKTFAHTCQLSVDGKHGPKTMQLTANVTDPDHNALPNDVAYSTDNPNAARVTTNGLVTAVGAGTAKITVAAGIGPGSASFQFPVTVTGAPDQKPVASIAIVNGNALSATFDGTGSYDPSGKPLTSYSWDFGDGKQGSGATVGHTYSTGGTYTVRLTVGGDGGRTGSATASVKVNQNLHPPKAAFATTGTRSSARFTNQTSNPDHLPVAYSWDFGDGSTSPSASPTHPFHCSDTPYQVTLTVSGLFPSSHVTHPVATTCGGPTGDFMSSANGLDVKFTSTITDPDGDAINYHWDFGDGQSSTDPNPAHSYADTTNVQVVLKVDDGNGHPFTVQHPVSVTKPNSPPTGTIQCTTDGAMQATCTSSITDPDGDTMSYQWDFGDHTGTSTDANPAPYTYTASGSYTVTVTVDDGHGHTPSFSIPNPISVAPANSAPTGNIQCSTDGAATVTCTSTITDPDGDTMSYQWDFGDNAGTSTDANPAPYTYTASGSYTVTLTVDDGHGHKPSFSIPTPLTITVASPPSTGGVPPGVDLIAPLRAY